MLLTGGRWFGGLSMLVDLLIGRLTLLELPGVARQQVTFLCFAKEK
jgi:hypothetical protein